MNPTTCHPMTAYNAKQTAKALRLLLRLAASLLMRPTTTRTNPRNPLRFAFLNFELPTETTPYRETVAFPCSLSARFCSVCCSVSARLHCKLLNQRHKPKTNCSVCVRFLLGFCSIFAHFHHWKPAKDGIPSLTCINPFTNRKRERTNCAPFMGGRSGTFEGVANCDPLATKGGGTN